MLPNFKQQLSLSFFQQTSLWTQQLSTYSRGTKVTKNSTMASETNKKVELYFAFYTDLQVKLILILN